MRFEIKAYREGDGVTLFHPVAASLDEARQQVEAQGYRVYSARARWRLPDLARVRLGQRFPVALFSQELLALLDAGLSLIEGLDLLARKARQADSRRLLEALARALREGRAFSRALEEAAGAFPPLYVATVRSSERTGNLAEALRRYLAYHQRVNRVRDKIASASVYPLLLILVGGLVTLFLLGYVVPRFSKVYADMGKDLPIVSRLLMLWGRAFADHAAAIAGAAAAVLAATAYALSRPAIRERLSRWLWSLPTLGEMLRLYQLARFSRTLAMLLKGGIAFVPALEQVGGLLRQPALQQGLREALRAVREGGAVAPAFERHGLANEVGVRLLAVGERSGEMAETMERIADFYDDEIARWVDWFVRLFEPLLMVFIGGVIGAIVLLLYLPIFELAGSIQ